MDGLPKQSQNWELCIKFLSFRYCYSGPQLFLFRFLSEKRLSRVEKKGPLEWNISDSQRTGDKLNTEKASLLARKVRIAVLTITFCVDFQLLFLYEFLVDFWSDLSTCSRKRVAIFQSCFSKGIESWCSPIYFLTFDCPNSPRQNQRG